MASIRRQGDRYEIRECVTTARGPRQRSLTSFQGILTPEVLDVAESNARRPFDRAAVRTNAARMEIPTSHDRRHPEARGLLAVLQRGADLEPTLVGLLKVALAQLEARTVPEHLEDAADWIGQPERERGAALRGLLRTADRILRSRAPIRTPEPEMFPRFQSEPAAQET